MNFFQDMLQMVEVGKGQIVVRIIPLLTIVFVVAFVLNIMVYSGLTDPQSMDNAQLARQIVRGHGFTTQFLRPHAVAQLHDYAARQGLQTGKPGDLFPANRFPAGTPRIIPDTYNAPGYPYLLAGWFYLIHPEFEQPASSMGASRMYSGDRWIPPLNLIFLALTSFLVFALGRRLFDDRVAWIALIAFLGTDLVWHYSMSALSTTVLMFLVTAAFVCAVEIFCVGEACFASEERSFAPAWWWYLVLGLLLAAACLTRLDLLVLLVPLLILLILMPQAHPAPPILVTLLVLGAVGPWFWHVWYISGSPLGSNLPTILYGQGDYKGNQVFCTTSIPSYELLFKNAGKKEYFGFRWNFEHAWNLLGSNPIILFFGASILHQFKRLRTRAFHWLLFGSAIVLVAITNLGSASPENFGPWNTLILLFPCMVVIGAAFFFILLDRLNLQLRILSHIIVIALLALTTAPLLLTLTIAGDAYRNFPPYLPALVKVFGQYAERDEWVTTDMPWATAWYADRASLWLPDSVSDFENLHDNVCPTGVLFLTPITWEQPFSALSGGEYREWFPLIAGTSTPSGFPLLTHTMTAPGGPDYSLWSDRNRWQEK